MSKLIRIGTRGNKLATGQAEYVASLINPSGYTTEITSTADSIEALEAQLQDGSIDLAIHNAKDLPSVLHDELELIAFTEREPANDVLLSERKNINMLTPAVRIGTSSRRRIAFLNHFHPGAKTVSVQGDLQSQIKKMKDGEYDALLVDYAYAHRMGYADLIIEKIETSYFVPAVGQGSIAVECHKKLSFDKKEILQRWVNHEETEDCIRTERSFIKAIQAGPSVPAFAYAQYEGNLITLKAGVISLDGKQVVKTKRSSTVSENKELGKKVAREVLQSGGEEILRSVKLSA